MKISSVTIEGMHKLGQPKKYTFNNLTYLYGPNGSGKSTVLEAIQLALLGYIPGMNKKNDAIFKHANSSVMRISLVFDNGSSIERRFINTGKGISTAVTTDPEGLDIESIVHDVELPIFNWSDFTGLSANQLKDWFISFLPEASDNIDWEKELTDSVEELAAVNKSDIIKRELDDIQLLAVTKADVNSLPFVREVNRTIKEDIACEKANIQRDTATLQNLTRYDDVPTVSYSQIQSEIEEATAKRNRLISSKRQFEQNAKITLEIQSLNLSANSLADDSEYVRLQDQLTEKNNQLSKLEERYTAAYAENLDAEKILSDVMVELKIASASIRKSDASGICPFTNEECSTAAKYVESKKAEIEEAEIEVHAAEEKVSDTKRLLQSVASEKLACTSTIQEIKNQIARLTSMYERRDQLNNLLVPVDGEDLIDTDPEVIKEEIDNKMQMLRKISANEAYDTMSANITKSKFESELRLKLLKNWEKLTGPNGLQTQIMNKPFLNLADELSDVLTQLMNEPISAKFNLSDKANSFSFGIVRDEKYIPFEVLSSGEQCMYVAAMMIHIVRNAESPLKVILIDDLLDHLDDGHMNSLLTSLSNIEDIQFILAGAKKYGGNEDIVVSL